MTAATRTDLRRGACPGLSTPMQTGDGLLVRLTPAGTITLDAMAALAAAARRCGNGIVEITSRGSIQIRGLTPESAPAFAEAAALLGIVAHDGLPVISDPLAGLDPTEVMDASVLATTLRDVLKAQSFATRLSPKVSVAIDGGGALHLDALAADIRLRAVATPDGPRLHVSVGRDVASAAQLGTFALADAVDTVTRLLGDIAARGGDARTHDVIDAESTHTFPRAPRAAADPIGVHRLRSNGVAVGLGFPFGHTDADTLEKLLHAARRNGATGLRTSPGRALLVLGVADDFAAQFVRAAGELGFIVDSIDLRRRVVACAGAPLCASGEIAARVLAPAVARDVAPLLGTGDVIHISGCAKGCAHRGPATLSVIGRAGACDLLVGDAPAGSCAVDVLPRRLAGLAPPPWRKVRHG